MQDQGDLSDLSDRVRGVCSRAPHRGKGQGNIYRDLQTKRHRTPPYRDRAELFNWIEKELLELTEDEYERRLAARDPRRQTIRKTRYCLPYAGHVFEIDVFPFWTRQAIMEVELKNENEEFTLPPFIKILREVSEDPAYSNHSLAREIPPEDQA